MSQCDNVVIALAGVSKEKKESVKSPLFNSLMLVQLFELKTNEDAADLATYV